MWKPSARNSHDQDQIASANSIPSDIVQPSIQPFSASGPLTLSQAIARDHPLDQITRDLNSVQTRSKLASFWEHYPFVSSIEPCKIAKALRDPN